MNAQRLGVCTGYKPASPDVVLPRMLGDLVKHDDEILKAREVFFQQKVGGNSKIMWGYKAALPKSLTKTQFEWAVGMMLGDGSMQTNSNCTVFRLKMQQAEKNIQHLKDSIEILKPNTTSNESKSKTKSKKRT